MEAACVRQGLLFLAVVLAGTSVLAELSTTAAKSVNVIPTTASNKSLSATPSTISSNTTSFISNTTAHTTTASTNASSTVVPSTRKDTSTNSSVSTATTKIVTEANSSVSTVTPCTAALSKKTSRFDVGSFVGGIILTVGILIILYLGCRFYNSRRGVQYRTIDEHEAII